MTSVDATGRSDLIAALQNQVRRLEGRQRPRDEAIVSTGCGELDRLFPENGLRRDTIEYFAAGLLGREFLKKGFKASYVLPHRSRAGGDKDDHLPNPALFIAVFVDSGEARDALKLYKKHLSGTRGNQPVEFTRSGLDMVMGHDTYQGTVITSTVGRYLVGAVGFQSNEDAEKLLAELIGRIP